MPVLPAVPSTIVPPGLSRPEATASSMMASAARSLTEPPGLRNSALPRISQPVASDARASRMSGVLPMVSMKPLRMVMGGSVPGWELAIELGRQDDRGNRPFNAVEGTDLVDQKIHLLDRSGLDHGDHIVRAAHRIKGRDLRNLPECGFRLRGELRQDRDQDMGADERARRLGREPHRIAG